MTIPPSLAQPSISQAPLEELDPNAINKSIIDAKGDLVTGIANDTPARLPVGTNGQVLIADSAQTTGLRWGTDPTSTIIDAKGDLLVGTANDTIGRLPVGSTGQVLVVDPTTGTGLKWSSEADPTAITKSIIDAKGDLIVGTAPDTPARLPIGTNGQYLVANSGTTEGVAWTTPNIALGTETTGNYVAGISGGTGVTVTGSGSEGATPTVAIGQDVATTATVAFGGLNVDTGTLYVDSTNNRVGINDTTPSYSLDVTGDGHFTTDLTVDGTLTAPHIHGNIAGSIYYHVKNVSGGVLTAGTPVYVSGTVGSTQVAEVQAARADTAAKMPAIGIVETDIAINATGHVVVIGAVQNLNTNAYALNEVLYVGATGGLTNVRPTGASDLVQIMGTVGRVNTNTGEVIVLTYDQVRAPNSISIPGNIVTTAGQFTGSGAGLTSIPAGQLTGTVPSAAIGNDSVALGTKTTGNYVQTVSAGTGVTVTGGTGEGSTPSIAIGQAVATTSTPQFAGLTLTGGANVTSISASSSVSANSLSSTTSISGASLTVDGIEIDTTGATANQVLAYDGTKFAPTSSGQLSSLIVSANSSTDAVRITQTGAGNALVVEDEANPDSTPFVVNASGQVGIGGTPTAGRTLNVVKALTGSTATRGIMVSATVQSDSTTSAHGVHTFLGTAAESFTVGTIRHFFCEQTTIGATSAVTDQVGFAVGSSLTGATNNYGFYGNLAAATGRWNLYMAGTANNYMAGRLGVGATLTSGAMAQVTNTTAADVGLVVKGATSQSGDLQQWQNSSGTVLAEITSTGKLIAAGIDGGTP